MNVRGGIRDFKRAAERASIYVNRSSCPRGQGQGQGQELLLSLSGLALLSSSVFVQKQKAEWVGDLVRE